VPAYDLYGDFPQLENGVGLVRCFLDEWEKTQLTAGYDQPIHIDVVCGVSAAKILGPLLADWKVPNLTVRLLPVENQFFGPSITVTGLLTGRDILAALQASDQPRDGVIIPGIALRKGENIFLDDMTLEELENQLGKPVRAAYFAADLRQRLADWR
jgi:NifB/MoaA-like Fe-S oxidoreductase